MRIKTSVFAGSSAIYKQCPQAERPDVALIGRSNVGKSSLINMLMGRKRLAKTSSRPGKTQLINHFLINDSWYLVDLPGYGWAQVSKVQRQQWAKMIKDYLLHRRQLLLVMVLVDARHPPQKLDLALINWLGAHHISFIILLTKADKEAKQQVKKNLSALQQILRNDWEVMPHILITSSQERAGREEVLRYIQYALNTETCVPPQSIQ
ncbi:MAG: ribosome biogenesis GTP-binding protein YihA/YsxC [Bacteroidota bacterium]